jgi:hypothetical protein
MISTIFHLDYEDKMVLGFDTGLSERSFAQSKAASLLSESGYVVFPNASINVWQAEGVIKLQKRMIIYGADFEGSSLDSFLQCNGDKDAALNAIRLWLCAVRVLSGKNIFPNPSPHGVIIAKDGTFFFPPSNLVKKSIDAEENETALTASLQFVHPDLTGEESFTFSAAVMLYQLFSGEAAFQDSHSEQVLNSIRTGNFLPVDLTAPSLDEKTADFINNAINPKNTSPSLMNMIELLGGEKTKQYNEFFKQISDEEKKSIVLKRKQFAKRLQDKAKAKIFFNKHKTIFIGVGIGLAAVIFIAWNIIIGLNNRLDTKGMTPAEIVKQYYASFGTLDHDFMEAATIGSAGESEIKMVQNLFVISKVREAYERTAPIIPAQEWVDGGSQETESMVFGVSNLEQRKIHQSEQEALFEADGLLWMPEYLSTDHKEIENAESEDNNLLMRPVSVSYRSNIKFTKRKDIWRIAEIITEE